MQLVNSTTPHYIRCIKPNAGCKAMTFQREEVTFQKLFLTQFMRSFLGFALGLLRSLVTCKALFPAHLEIAFAPFKMNILSESLMMLVQNRAGEHSSSSRCNLLVAVWEVLLREHFWVIWGDPIPVLKIHKDDLTAQQSHRWMLTIRLCFLLQSSLGLACLWEQSSRC